MPAGLGWQQKRWWVEVEEERRKENFFLCFRYFKGCNLKFLRSFFNVAEIKMVKKLVKDKLGKNSLCQTRQILSANFQSSLEGANERKVNTLLKEIAI